MKLTKAAWIYELQKRKIDFQRRKKLGKVKSEKKIENSSSFGQINLALETHSAAR